MCINNHQRGLLPPYTTTNNFCCSYSVELNLESKTLITLIFIVSLLLKLFFKYGNEFQIVTIKFNSRIYTNTRIVELKLNLKNMFIFLIREIFYNVPLL